MSCDCNSKNVGLHQTIMRVSFSCTIKRISIGTIKSAEFFEGGKMNDRLTWYGHSAIGIETDNYHILVDPYFTDNPKATTSAKQVEADYILISHGHGDHIGDTVTIAKRTNATVICVFEIAEWLNKKGVKVHAQHIGGGYMHPFGYLKFTQAFHGSMLPDGSYGGNPAGFLLTTKSNKKIYLAGDTGLFGDMRLIGEEEIDLAALPIGDNFTMGPQDALRAVKLLQPKCVVPIHYNTWDRISQDPNTWAKEVRVATGVKVKVLEPGESLEF
jgi:L-ascorbate metabolism protein UlaG (beta-lactamase superfamily)